MMKKTAAGLLVSALILSTGFSTFAAGPEAHYQTSRNAGNGLGLKNSYYASSYSRFIDADGDGVCDNFTAVYAGRRNERGAGQGFGFVDADGDGVCDNNAGQYNSGRGYGPAFTDEDGDGVCDHFATRQKNGNRGAGFTDADGDGICDHASTFGGGRGAGGNCRRGRV